MLTLPRATHLMALAALCACGTFALTLRAATSTPMMSMGGMNAAKPADAAQPSITGDGKAETTLSMDVRKFDFAGTKAANRMYMPASAKLSPNKPEGITKEPQYQGTPKYATITIGNGTPGQFVLVADEAEGHEPKFYADLNGDGNLTNDGNGDWQTKLEGTEGRLPSYESTLIFKPGWKTPEGGNTVGEYALNFYWQPGRGQINYYSASARVGKITIDGKAYDVTLLENDGDGLYNKLYDASKPIVVGDRMTAPVWLLLDGDQYDIRGTFPFAGMNYLATVTDDGSTLKLTPTMKVILPPRGRPEKSTLLAAGVEAPDFEALMWSDGQTKLDTSNRFKLSDFRGKKIVVIDMWATWCGPCMKSIPHLSKVAEAVQGQDVAVIALNTSDDVEPFEHFATGKGKEYKFILARDPAGRDENGNTIAHHLYGVTGIPATFVIDKTGKIAGTVSGYAEGDKRLEQILKGLGVKID
ncbi:MAG TPA: TlpA disulfide reductase family protein [Phycisphaerae bacterium]|nr:TlpA disulfide reductase family protein [Phycisphaerae bacterium]